MFSILPQECGAIPYIALPEPSRRVGLLLEADAASAEAARSCLRFRGNSRIFTHMHE
jgi:hypothetical protein